MSDIPESAGAVVGEAARLLGTALGELVPPDAQMHLLNAQRELLLALAVIIEHNASRSRSQPRGRRTSAQQGRPSRPTRVELD